MVCFTALSRHNAIQTDTRSEILGSLCTSTRVQRCVLASACPQTCLLAWWQTCSLLPQRCWRLNYAHSECKADFDTPFAHQQGLM